MNDDLAEHFAKIHGRSAADQLYVNFIAPMPWMCCALMRMSSRANDPAHCERTFRRPEAEEAFPQDPVVQLRGLRSMARAWEGTTARLLRQAGNAPADAGLGLVVAHGAGINQVSRDRGLCR